MYQLERAPNCFYADRRKVSANLFNNILGNLVFISGNSCTINLLRRRHLSVLCPHPFAIRDYETQWASFI